MLARRIPLSCLCLLLSLAPAVSAARVVARERPSRQTKARARAVIAEALAVAKRIGDEETREDALLKIVSPLSLIDVDRALALARRSKVEEGWPQDEIIGIAEDLAKTNPDKAIAIADSMGWETLRASALSLVAQALAEVNPARSRRVAAKILRLAHTIADGDKRAQAVSSAAYAFARADPATAVKLAKSIQDAGDLSHIVELLAETDPRRALGIAAGIRDNFYRAVALMEVSRALSRTQPSRAHAVVERVLKEAPGIKDGDLREGILGQCATELVKTGPTRAIRLARSIQKADDRGSILCQLAVALAKRHPAQAKQLIEEALGAARSITDGYYRDFAFSHIAYGLAATYPDKAFAVWRMIHSEPDRGMPLTAIFRQFAKRDLEGALAKAKRLENASDRTAALLVIVEQLAWTGKDDRALKLARSITDDSSRVEALCDVAAAMLSRRDNR